MYIETSPCYDTLFGQVLMGLELTDNPYFKANTGDITWKVTLIPHGLRHDSHDTTKDTGIIIY